MTRTTWKRAVVFQAAWLLGGAGTAGAVTPTNVTKVARVTPGRSWMT